MKNTDQNQVWYFNIQTSVCTQSSWKTHSISIIHLNEALRWDEIYGYLSENRWKLILRTMKLEWTVCCFIVTNWNGHRIRYPNCKLYVTSHRWVTSWGEMIKNVLKSHQNYLFLSCRKHWQAILRWRLQWSLRIWGQRWKLYWRVFGKWWWRLWRRMLFVKI